MKSAVLITAAGRGTRAGGGARPKQYRPLAGKIILRRTLEAFAACPSITTIMTVIHPTDQPLYEQAVRGLKAPLSSPVTGGATRQQSIFNGLAALAANPPDWVLIHDAARPLVSRTVIDRVIAALDQAPAVLPALPVTDTVKQVLDNQVIRTVPREDLWLAQTPQGFHFDAILAAHQAAAHSGIESFTDDASIAEWHGVKVQIVMGEAENIKITTPSDFHTAEMLLQRMQNQTGNVDNA